MAGSMARQGRRKGAQPSTNLSYRRLLVARKDVRCSVVRGVSGPRAKGQVRLTEEDDGKEATTAMVLFV